MLPVLQPGQIGQEMMDCMLLGVAAGLVRGWFPVRGKAAFVPDLLWAGAGLFAAQSYAAGYSASGQLRWYMLAAVFAGAMLSAGVVGPPLRAAGRAFWTGLRIPFVFLHRFAAKHTRRARRGGKRRNNAKRNAEKSKKNLPNQRTVLYNSNVSQ